MSASRLHVAVQHKFDAIEVLGSAHEEWAADAERSSGTANAETGAPAVSKRDGMQPAVAFQDLSRSLVGLCDEVIDALSLLFRLNDAQCQPGVIHHRHQ